ncbi:glucose-1-phosphate adenylyltransferase large subunit 1-like [Arachis duranensis]|uniref:Glucose-1-phosphate adenylyltransferase n=1 Tax=Arachis duranensis TaxID=130453 RepID=A0A6P4DY70_ARADU|nr:glucose-1-phosphate adenylyltransferase large subunit 1-like [Arachis duranensis]XP_057720452.1 glucose-1-phosphate adenylyltransferase large subunit 1-like [Arachis stenosperma]
MDSALAILNNTSSINLVSKGVGRKTSSSFWGESAKKESLNSRFFITQPCNKNLMNKRKLKHGIAHAVYTPDMNSMVYPKVIFQNPKPNPENVAAIILGGGAGTRLFPLTSTRAKPAVPIGGCYRLIDIPMSNCINSGVKKIYVLTQYNSFSLNGHLSRTYNCGNGVFTGTDFVEVLAATQTPGEAGKEWFQGTADAVRRFIWVFEDAKHKNIENVLILSGDHLCRMDYMKFLERHTESNADVTIACVPMDESRASDYELVKIDRMGRVRQFAEKPKGSDLKEMQVDPNILGLPAKEAKENLYMASMGVYVFRTEILLKLLRLSCPSCNDLGSEIIPTAVRDHKVQSYLFRDYWEDIGTIKSFYDANMALTEQPPKFEFYDPKTPFYTSPRFLPPTKVLKSKIVDAIISHGCFLSECNIQRSVIGVRSCLASGSVLEDTMMMGADYYETDSEIESLVARGKVPIGVGENTKIRNCIIDKNARIGRDVIIANCDGVQEADKPEEGFYIRSGIIVVVKNATIKDGTVI